MNNLATCTASPLVGAEKTIRLLPAGMFRAIDGRPVGIPGWQLQADFAEQIVKAAALRSDDFVIDYEHQTLQSAKNGQPAPAAGWFKKLEWREGQGLFAVDVRWTERAAAMIRAGEYRYISPVFGFDGKTGSVQYIQSAAITNFAALDGLTDMAAAKGQIPKSIQKAPLVSLETEEEHCKRVLDHCFPTPKKVAEQPVNKKDGSPVFSGGGSVTYPAGFTTVGCCKVYK